VAFFSSICGTIRISVTCFASSSFALSTSAASGLRRLPRSSETNWRMPRDF